jgi:hypothetical protein
MASATDEMKKSTNAAMLSAKTLVASERPLLVVSPEPVKDEPHTFVLRVVNEGKGPAQLCGGGAGSGQQAVDFSPADSDFRGFIPNPLKSLFVNEDGFVVGGKIVGQDMTISGKITKMFQIYGRIEYWDIFSDRTEIKPYVTQWCFIYNFGTQEFYITSGDSNQNT